MVCKISGLVDGAPDVGWTTESLATIIHYCLEAFGPDRLVFASDWPVCLRGATLRQWVETLWLIVKDWPEDHQKKAERISSPPRIYASLR